MTGISNKCDLVPANDPVQSWTSEHGEFSPRTLRHNAYSIFDSLIIVLLKRLVWKLSLCMKNGMGLVPRRETLCGR